ncbi:MAG TPA: PQQ-dependent sugar dehydrogenase [Thermoanaerobaculia bacterium]|nr:PQQ-dependent sugar dehydrogenase [Thermoanaerobaculia bacterium]
MRPFTHIIRLILPGLAGLAVARPTLAITLPPGFTDNLVAAVAAPTALAFTPDGRLLVTSQGGDLRVVTPGGVLLGTPALSLGARVCSDAERGLLGVAVDPTFASNHFIYLFYTFNKDNAGCPTIFFTIPVERVSRYTLPDTNVIDPASELVLIDNVLNFAGNHNGGNVLFGPDGFLYASIGDGGCDYAGDSGCQGSNDASRDRNVLIGKILRIAPDGSIPASNPFQGAGTARCNMGPAAPGLICQEAFAWGLRNPFRFTFQPGTGTLFINDVGSAAFEEVDIGQAGADYGWPSREGAHPQMTTGKCSPTPPSLVEPFFEYQHGLAIPGTSATGCGAITGGAFVPAGVWTSFDGAYLFGDVNCGAIVRLNVAGGSATATNFATGIGVGVLVHLAFGPSAAGQSLYYTTYGAGGQVHRIDGPAPAPLASTFTPLPPCRVLDTRDPAGPLGGPSLQPGASRTFALAGRCGIPLDATAVAANVTVTNLTTDGSLRIGPAGTASALDTLDFRTGVTRANNSILGLFGLPAGSVTVSSGFASGTADVVIDVNGWWR